MSYSPCLRLSASAAACVAALAALSACSSAPKAVVPDGATRVAVNDPARIEALRARAKEDAAALEQRERIAAEIRALQDQVRVMRGALQTIVDNPGALPPRPGAPATPVPQSYVAPPASVAPQAMCSGHPSSACDEPVRVAASFAAAPATHAANAPLRLVDVERAKLWSALAPRSIDVTVDGVVFRVFHAQGSTRFAPDAAMQAALLNASKDATQITVWGNTDRAKVSASARRLAVQRAAEARTWLLAQGVPSDRVRVRYSSAGNRIADNTTVAGQALNRRVDVRMTGDFSGAVAATAQAGGVRERLVAWATWLLAPTM